MARTEPNQNELIAVRVTIDENLVPEFDCGKLTEICQFCQSRNFLKEKPADGKFNICCNKGKVVLEPVRVNKKLETLMTNNHTHHKNFMANIRSYNSAFAFASMGAQNATPLGFGPYCFRIHGQIHHRAGTLHPNEGEQRKFAQLYILDPPEAILQRMDISENVGCLSELMEELGILFTEINPYSTAFKMLHEVEKEAIQEAQQQGIQATNVLMAIRQDRNSDVRRYNAPRICEVAIIFQNADGEPPLERDLLIHCRMDPNNPTAPKTKRINVLDNNLEPMTYPILFPYGDLSWGPNLSLRGNGKRTRVTQMMYYGHRLSIRNDFNPFLSAGKLTKQFFVDAYIKTEANRLNWVRNNQSKLRIELYSGLVDHINTLADQQGILPGVPMVLPSSFQGSPRNMAQNYQDAMAIVRKYGKPDLFVTMTCNPKWKEISDHLPSYQSIEHRPDLVARVFKLKLKELLNDIMKKDVFGKCIAKIHVIEFHETRSSPCSYSFNFENRA